MREILFALLKVLLIPTFVVVISFGVWIFFCDLQPMEISEAWGITCWPFFTFCEMLIIVALIGALDLRRKEQIEFPVIELGRKHQNPRAVELLTAEGPINKFAQRQTRCSSG